MVSTHEGQGDVCARAAEQAVVQSSAGRDGILGALGVLLDGVECRVAQGVLPGAAERFVHFQVQLEQHLVQEERLLALLLEGAAAGEDARRAAEGGWNAQLRHVAGIIRVQLQRRDATGVAGQLSGLRELLADHRVNDVTCLWPLLQRTLSAQELGGGAHAVPHPPGACASFASTRSRSAARARGGSA